MTTDSAVTNWNVERLPDLSGRTYFITGANSGLGYECADHLRRKNANVILGARSLDKGQAASTKLGRIDGNGSIDLVQIDLADTASIRAADVALREVTDGLDAVVNNAGVMQTPQLETADGFELQFGTNHLGHFLLNQLVFDLVAARSGRIVPVSSLAHLRSRAIQFDDIMYSANYSATYVYGQSKLANLMYGLELSRRLEAAGSEVQSISCHPGYSATNLQSTGPTGLFKLIYKVSNLLVAQSAASGAAPLALAAAGTEARNGAYYGPTQMGDTRGSIGDSTIADKARDLTAAARLWEVSEDLLGIEFKIT